MFLVQVKIFNLISRFVCGEYAINVRDSGWPLNEQDEDEKRRKPDYQGATVIEPLVGFYEDCISTLDFESLYPSIIRYFNLCPSVLLLDCVDTQKVCLERHTIQHNVFRGSKYETEERVYTFITSVQGVLPKLLTRLLDARKAVKRMMAACDDPLQKAVLNGRQNGIKVACNSVYGFCGVSQERGLLPCKPVAAVTTLKGRAFIEAAKHYVESHYEGSKVIYGDTVRIATLLLLLLCLTRICIQDSVMIFWGKIDVPEAAAKGEEAAAAITKLLREGKIADIGGAGALASGSRQDLAAACSAVSLAYEKTYRPYLLLKKKNYAGVKYTLDGAGFKTEIDLKGIDAVRRDRPKLLRDTSNAILRELLFERSATKALATLGESLQRIASGLSPLEDFVLSKSLKSSYASSNLPHVTAWKRMAFRGDEGVPPVGARMPYVVVVDAAGRGGKKAAKLYERTEHPDFVRTSKRKVDFQYYVETLQNPLTKLLQFVAPEAELKRLFREASERASMTASSVGSLRDIASGSFQRVVVQAQKPKRKREETREERGAGLRAFFT